MSIQMENLEGTLSYYLLYACLFIGLFPFYVNLCACSKIYVHGYRFELCGVCLSLCAWLQVGIV
jgi:hypothetical protein